MNLIFIFFINLIFTTIYILGKKECKENYCLTFTIGEDTGCNWMCDYCAQNLGTNNFYFTDWICTNNNGMCTGNPSAWEEYTCCSLD